MTRLELDVDAVAAGGDGIAREPEGRVVFVRGALPGERVVAELDEQRRDFARAHAIDVVTASPDRVAAPCPYVAAGCGGCDWQHLARRAQPRLKARIVADALRRGAHLEVDVDHGDPLPAAAGHRTTVRAVAVDGRLAFRRRASHDLIGIDRCLVAHPLLDELIHQGRFPDGEVTLRAGARTGERLVIVDGDPTEVDVPPDVRIIGRAQLRSGARAWYHEVCAGRRWRISARSFFQASAEGADALAGEVATAVADGASAGDRLVDLYGGVGLLAGAAADAVRAGGTRSELRLTVVEQGASSVADARHNLADVRAKVLKLDVERWRPSPAEVVIADPPRAGLGKGVVRAVAGTGARRVVLVSCDPAALARDVGLLVGAGFSFRRVGLIDMFPHTSHVEAVSVLDR